jgi:hypothetical protein
MTKSFPVPVGSNALRVAFKVYELESNTSFELRLADAHLRVGSFEINVSEGEINKFLRDIWLTTVGIGPTVNLVTLIIPASWYNSTGFLTVGFKSGNGVDDFSITSICDSTDFGPETTMAPTTSPTSHPTLQPSVVPSEMPSLSPTTGCTPDVKVTSTGSMDFNYPPVEVISQNDDTVKFSASQVWSETSVSAVAISFLSPSDGEMCDSKENVPPGQFDYHTALCVDGVAAATTYVQDQTFGDLNSVDSIPILCSPIQAGQFTIEYTFSIPCMMASSDCPVPELLECDGTDNMFVLSETMRMVRH